jgi:hypothetical protein
MSHTAKIKRGWTFEGEVIELDETETGGQLVTIDEDVADSETDYLIALTLDVSQIQALFITSDQAITLETNSGAAPDDTITLAANGCVIWTAADGASLNPLQTDVTALYVTNASGSTATLRARFLVDPTV